MKRYSVLFFITIAVFLFSACIKVNVIPLDKNFYVQQCGLFVIDNVPDEKCSEWKFKEDFHKDDIQSAKSYTHRFEPGLMLGVWYYWDTLGMKVWECTVPRQEEHISECMFSILGEDGAWSRPTVGFFIYPHPKLTDYGKEKMPFIRWSIITKDGSVMQRNFKRPG